MADGFDALEASDPVVADIVAARGRAPEHHDPADRVRELHLARGARGAGLGAHQQVLRGLPGASATTAATSWSTRPRSWPGTRACALFGAEHANVQPHSGANANMAVYLALFSPGDKLMGMRLDQGGHLTHGSPVNFSGRIYDFVAYGVDPEAETLDYDVIRDLAKAERPKAIIAGATAYSRTIDFAAFRSIADEIGALLIVDAAHIAGLIAGGAHPNPVPHADVVTFTTHKTLRGPRAGTILCREQYAAAIDKAVFPGLQGGPLMHVVAAKAVAFHLAAQPEFREYAAQIVRNAAALAGGLADEGFRIVSGGTDNHLMLVDLRPVRRHREGRPGGARPVRDHLQQERDPERPREAVRHERAAPRHRRGHHRGHGRVGDGGDRVADRLRAPRPRRRGGVPGCARRREPALREVHAVPRARIRPVESARIGGWLRGRLRGSRC